MEYYNRYKNFLVNGNQTVVPFVTIPSKGSDKRFIYRTGLSRLDRISMEFYNTPYFGWLILAANPKFGGLEDNIKDQSVLFIPYSLNASLQDYNSALENHFFYYGR
jgi:hypothetical protein